MNRVRYAYLSNGKNPYNRGFLNNWFEFFGVLEPVKFNFKEYYKFYLEGNSEIVDKNNRALKLEHENIVRFTPQNMASHSCNHENGYNNHMHMH